jgi:hypothetical protein
VDAGGLAGEVAVLGAGDDPGVRRAPVVEVDEVATVDREQGPTAVTRQSQHDRIWDRLLGEAGVEHGEHVVTEPAQFLDDGLGEVLVGEEAGHRQASSFSRTSRSISSGWAAA